MVCYRLSWTGHGSPFSCVPLRTLGDAIQHSYSVKDSRAVFTGQNGRCAPRKSLIGGMALAFHGGNTGSNPVGDAKSFQRLRAKESICCRHKREQQTAKSLRPAVPELHFPRFDGFFVGTKRHNLTPQLPTRLRERETSEQRRSELRVFVP